ncbi:MAG: hypothetical protein WBN18_10945 [Flavobacteriaceae bacterium]
MIPKVKNVLKKRKVQLFFLFLLCSGLAWFVSNLSYSYPNSIVLELDYLNPPDSLRMAKASKNTIEVKLEAVGFQLLAINLGDHKFKMDLTNVKNNEALSYLSPAEAKRQLEQQLPKGVKLLETDGDTLFFKFFKVVVKKVPVHSAIHLNFSQNHMLDGPLQIIPDQISVSGPKNEIDTLVSVTTEKIELNDLQEDFSIMIDLLKPNTLTNTKYSTKTVQIKGKVAKFSEKVINVPIQVLNLPQGTVIQTFPEVAKLLIKAKLDDLKGITASDFQVFADYGTLGTPGQKKLRLFIGKRPLTVYTAEIIENEVDFILKRE